MKSMTLCLVVIALGILPAQAQLPFEFLPAGYIDNGGDAKCVAEGLDGTVFLANGNDGLRAYHYTGFSPLDGGSFVPKFSALEQNFPNPFNPSTRIDFVLPEQAVASVRIYDVTGQLVASLIGPESIPAGRQQIEWDGRNDAGVPVPSGTYFYRLEAGQIIETKSMVLMK